jgi:Protein of unknown function (DUF2846)
MRRLLLLVPALLLVLSGCAATTKGGAAFSEARVEPGKALVYVYRHDAVAGEWAPAISIAGAPGFDLPNQRYAALNLAPGPHLVRALWPRRSDIPNAETTLSVEPNQTYYVRVASETHDGAMGSAVVFYMTAKTSVRAVQREEAMKSLPQAKSAL